jgi:hypothetical protein
MTKKVEKDFKKEFLKSFWQSFMLKNILKTYYHLQGFRLQGWKYEIGEELKIEQNQNCYVSKF